MNAEPKFDPRTIEILAKIKTVFAQKGFDGASMQDLARAAAAGLEPPAVVLDRNDSYPFFARLGDCGAELVALREELAPLVPGLEDWSPPERLARSRLLINRALKRKTQQFSGKKSRCIEGKTSCLSHLMT